jgi:phage terminase small subunit
MASQSRKSAARTAGRPISPKQARFVAEYLIDLNASKAAIRAGYSPKTAGSQAFDLLKKPEIVAEVDRQRQIHAENTGLTVERVLKEAMRLAFFDVRKLVDKDGNPIPVSELDDDTAAAIQGLELASERSRDEDGQETTVRKYKVADKNSAIERLFKHLGLFDKDNKQKNPGDAMTQFMADLSARGSRLPIKKADQ